MFRQTDELRLGAVDVDVELRIVAGLVDMQIDRAGHPVQFLQQIIREYAVGRHIESDDLHIDGRGQAEVQYLGNHVSRQERERRRRIGCPEPGAQHAYEVRGGLMALVEIHEYIGIARTHRRRGAVRQIDAAVGKSQIVDDVRNLILRDHFADRCLDRVAERGGFLDAGAGARAQMQLDLAAVDGREKILAESRQRSERKGQQGGGGHRAQEDGRETRTAVQGGSQQRAIPFAHLLEAAFESLLKSREEVPALGLRADDVFLEPELCQRRDQRTRQNVGGQHGENHGFGQGDEQEFGDAGEQEHGHEHDADRQGRDQRRQGDLVRAVENRGFHILAVLEMVVDVLDGDRRIVDQDADRKGESAQGHDVDRLAERGQTANRGQDRQGD